MARPPLIALGLLAATLAGCGPQYSPNTYASSAVQQASKVDKGVVIGVRRVQVSAPGVVGAASGAAAGGIAGSQTPGSVGSAFGALGGGLLGGLVGSGVEHVASDTAAYEYIVRKTSGDLVSVTQKDLTPLALGTKVLVIAGSQARIVPDYTVATDATTPAAGPTAGAASPTPNAPPAAPPETQPVPPEPSVTATPLPPPANPATVLP